MSSIQTGSSLEGTNAPVALPSGGELERQLSQKIQTCYADRVGHLPAKVICHLFGQELVILLEKSTTPIEQVLTNKGSSKLSFKVRKAVDKQIKQDVVQIVESVLGVVVRGVMVDTSHSLEQTGMIVVLSATPAVRNPDYIPKTQAHRRARKQKSHRA